MAMSFDRRFILAITLGLGAACVHAAAQTPDVNENLSACMRASYACDRSKLTSPEMTQVTRALHRSNVSACRDGWQPCDPSDLTPTEANALAVEHYRHNLSNCTEVIGTCDHAKL